MQELLTNVSIGIISGLASGLYVGIVMAKFTSFCQVRLAIFSVCRGFSFGGTNGKLDHAEFARYTEIADNASNLLYLGHKKAGNDALSIFKEVADTNLAIEMRFRFLQNKQTIPEGNIANITVEDVSKRHSDWQTRSRNLQPNWKMLISPNFRL